MYRPFLQMFMSRKYPWLSDGAKGAGHQVIVTVLPLRVAATQVGSGVSGLYGSLGWVTGTFLGSPPTVHKEAETQQYWLFLSSCIYNQFVL